MDAAVTNAEYAPLADIMGRSLIGSEPFNCSAHAEIDIDNLVSQLATSSWERVGDSRSHRLGSARAGSTIACESTAAPSARSR